MYIDFLLDVFKRNQEKDAIIWHDQTYSYCWMLNQINQWANFLSLNKIAPGSVVALEADFSPNAMALWLALIEHKCIIVPLSDSIQAKKAEYRRIAQIEIIIKVDLNDNVTVSETGLQADHELLNVLRKAEHPGLILFSSGSTGKNKGALHDLIPLLEKFKVPRHSQRALIFLLFDHIGGINTLLYNLSNAGCVITVHDRTPDTVCKTIEKYRVEVLPTSPTFINLILLSEAYKRYDLSSLQLVTYGTEVMPESVLNRFHDLFPNVKLLQTYGLSEIGILRSKSKSSDSLWVKVGGEGFETRVVDGMLEIKAQSAMLGYLNAPSPFSSDGWLRTGDAVEVDGEYIKILGRKSEIINVGGEKVYPIEVESVLLLMDGVEDVAVNGENNPITGQMVVAYVKLKTEEALGDFRKRMRIFCKDKLASFKIPQKVVLVKERMYGERFKKMRKAPENFEISFEQQKKEMIQKAGADKILRRDSLNWIINTAPYKYSYNFSWMGRPVIQFPQDLMAMQEIIWQVKPRLIIETGIAHGGSLIFYASMLELIGNDGEVLGIDIEIRKHNQVEIENHVMYKRIQMIEGSSVDPNIIAQVKKIAKDKAPVLVVLDSMHTHKHVLEELIAYSPLVTKNSYLVVFDTVIEDMPDEAFPDRPWGKGNNPKTAVWEFLKTNDRFVVDKDIENKLLITVAPDGYLKCIK